MKWQPAFRLAFIIYVLAVSYLSLSQPSGITDISSWDKLAHASAYAVFALLCGFMTSERQHFWLALLFCCGFGLLIEYLQSLTPYRTGSWLDILANLAGLACGTLAFHAGKRLAAPYQSQPPTKQ